jgi:ribonuclease P/MRP protein subunit POP8
MEVDTSTSTTPSMGAGSTTAPNTAAPPQASSSSSSSSAPTTKAAKSHVLASHTVRSAPFAYAHLELVTAAAASDVATLDAIQVRTYLTSALRQFLGASGQAVAVDVLRVAGARCWLRVPRDDLSAFAAAVAAWQGTAHEGGSGTQHATFRMRGCSDWLGGLVGQDGMEQVWLG